MKNFLRLIALLLCVVFLPLSAMAKEEPLDDGVTQIALHSLDIIAALQRDYSIAVP